MKNCFIARLAICTVAFFPCLAAAEAWGIAMDVKLDEGRLIIDPPPGQQVTREIGESLVRTGLRQLRTTTTWNVTLKDDAAGKMGFMAMYRAVKASAGASGPLLFHSNEKSPMFCVTPQGGTTNTPAEMAGCFVDTDKDGKFDALAFPGHGVDKDLPVPAAYDLKPQTNAEELEDSRSYFVEVLYQGVSKGEAKISYREFKGGIARPAFTQDVSYELETDGSGVIAFRGLRIQIVKATREGITYIVQKLGAVPL